MLGSHELRQKRAKLIEDAGAILAAAQAADRTMNAEEVLRFDAMHTDASAIWTQVERAERQETLDRELADARGRDTKTKKSTVENPDSPEAIASAEREAFRSWLAGGWGAMTPEQRQIQTRQRDRVGNANVSKMIAEAIASLSEETRAAQTVTTSGGGYLIPQGFQNELDIALKAFGGMRQACRTLTTATGNPLMWPTLDDTSNTGRLLTINTQVTNTGIAVGQVQLDAYKFSSESILVPSELDQDSAINIEEMVRTVMEERLGRVTNTYLTTGTGSSQPNGIVTAASDSGIDVDISDMATGADTTYLRLLEIVHSVDPAYRAMSGCGWMFHDTMLLDIRKVLDANKRPIFSDAVSPASLGSIGTLLGFPVFVNQDVPAPTTNTNKAVLFGALKKYIIRQVRPMIMLRLAERYADYDQIGYMAFERLDGELLNTAAVKYANSVT